jgi:hypothetical protein
MSEPELPGFPAAPSPPLSLRLRRLFTTPKLPGWAVLLLLVIQWVPDWKYRFDFWLDAARQAGGYVGGAADVIGSPYFSLGMATAGILWLAFVGEPQRGVLRDPRWRYVGWAIFGICLSAIVITAVWGSLQAYIAKEVTQRTTEQFWHLRPDQTEKLGKALDAVPVEQRFPIQIRVVFANAQALTLGNDLIEEFQRHGWTVSGGQDMSLRPDLLGINFIVALDWGRKDKDMPPHAKELADIFDHADVKYSGAWERNFANNSLQLAIGSRPPDW